MDKLILPGVGAFGEGMRRLLYKGAWIQALNQECLNNCKPLLEICLGMQLLAHEGTEFGKNRGLDFISGKVEKFHFDENEYRLPHIGWNTVKFKQGNNLYKGL